MVTFLFLRGFKTAIYTERSLTFPEQMFFKPTFTKSFVPIFFIETHLRLIMDVVLNFYEAAATEKPVCQEETRREAFG